MLRENNMPMHLWGTGTNRTLNDLFVYHERDAIDFRNGKTEGIVIDVQVAVVIVMHHFNNEWLELFEAYQLFPNGQKLDRSKDFNGIGETMKRRESLESAAQRCLKEELGFGDPKRYELSDSVTIEHWAPRSSEKWPGIVAVYHRHIVECMISRELYQPNGYVEPDGNREIHFRWRPLNQPALL